MVPFSLAVSVSFFPCGIRLLVKRMQPYRMSVPWLHLRPNSWKMVTAFSYFILQVLIRMWRSSMGRTRVALTAGRLWTLTRLWGPTTLSHRTTLAGWCGVWSPGPSMPSLSRPWSPFLMNVAHTEPRATSSMSRQMPLVSIFVWLWICARTGHSAFNRLTWRCCVKCFLV